MVRRAAVCLTICLSLLIGFYLSLIVSAEKPDIEQKAAIRRAIGTLSAKGFAREAFLLSYATTYRSNDNWLNASVAKENAYAATNFPFEIMTVYPDFFTYPSDDVERAAILLHESKHLEGKNEHDAYKFVWMNRVRLGWTRDKYAASPVWQNVRKQTRDNAPELFTCPDKESGDCTE
ncbi:MAG: hypothetical protein JO053_13500 [Acidobacteria bacterium]|nr:hypothetical protein [Acidobacteriota bacterium]